MANHKVYQIVPSGGWWQIRHENSFISTHRIKDEAIAVGQKIAIGKQPSHLVVQRADGTVETEWTYGDDPVPAKS
ncbi:DUF2188 domain-containing protein [Frankia sp. R82]|uniref:DUF2188 domain-containing protein n=1 Tax=Frankia sp. R82 TaxID=2950553 RepID=UPI002044CCD8|nr:DUF2188 domain-containing protein [Frankia sp. R82]MCM3883668.1 DUF2188 domain-containing protein [Frankia sp. R82]